MNDKFFIPKDFDWNSQSDPLTQIIDSHLSEPTPEQASKIEIVDESRRDGIQGIEKYPTDQLSIEYIYLAYKLGIRRITIGMYPGDNDKVDASINYLLKQMRIRTPKAIPIVLSLANNISIDWVEKCKNINPNLEAIVFMGTAPIRMFVENWSEQKIIHQLAESVKYATDIGIPVIGATEHTTQTTPKFLKQIVTTHLENGAHSFCIADTIGTARPKGAYRIVKFVDEVAKELGKRVPIEWHGHRDLGNDVGNSLAAMAAGAKRVHVTSRGVGERAGNTQLESVLLNLDHITKHTKYKHTYKLKYLTQLLNAYSQVVDIPPPYHGVLGKDHFTFRSGLHNAALYKAFVMSDEAKEERNYRKSHQLDEIRRTVYSSVDPELVGANYDIKISPLSGAATVKLVYVLMGGDVNQLKKEHIDQVLRFAQEVRRDLTEAEILSRVPAINNL